MPFLLSPIGNESQVNQNGAPLSGGTISTYLAGTSTVSPTFTDNTGTVAQTNPIVLNTLGLPPQPIWLNDVASYKFIIKDSNGVVTRTVDNIVGVAGSATAPIDQWVLFGGIPTFINATTFSVMSDQTGIFLVNRRTKSVTTSGIVYSSVVSSTFSGGITTVVLVNDAGVPGALNAGLTQVYYGILTSTSGALPADVARNSYLTFTGVSEFITGGTPPNFTLAPNPPITAYANGQRFRVQFHANWVGPGIPTLSVNGLAAAPIYGISPNGNPYYPAISVYHRYDMVSDGSNFIVINPLASDGQIGSIVPFAGNFVPSWGIICNGAAVSRTTYSRLFNVIGGTWGGGDGSTTFNVPNFWPAWPMTMASGNVGSSTAGEIKSHVHGFRTLAIANIGSTRQVIDGTQPVNFNTEATGGAANIPAGFYVNFCVIY